LLNESYLKYNSRFFTLIPINFSKNEKLTPDEIKKMSDIQKSLSTLIDGGYVGKPPRMIE